MRIWLLGGFCVLVRSRVVGHGSWRLRKAASLVNLLALAPNHYLHREQIMEALWPELGRRTASINLRQVLHVARGALETDPPAGLRHLASQDKSVLLCPEGSLWVDVKAFGFPSAKCWTLMSLDLDNLEGFHARPPI